MSLTASRSLLALAALGLLLSGCGLTQRVADGTSSFAHGLFYKQVKVLHLDFSARTALNTDTRDMSALSVSTLLRVYQLRDRKALDKAAYQDLLRDADGVLAEDLLDQQAVLVKPGEGAQFNVPLAAEAQFVAVVGLFRSPEAGQGNWRLVLAREELDPDLPRTLELGDSALTLLPMQED